MTNLYRALSDRFASAHDDAFLRTAAGSWVTYGQFDQRAARMAAVLREVGVGVGDRVVAQVPKSTDNIALYCATLRLGAVYVPLNTAYTAAELDYFVGDAEPALVVTADADDVDRRAAAGFTLDASGTGSLSIAADEAEPLDTIVERGPEDLAAMVYTSGTTGRSKGAMVTHGNLVSNAVALHRIWRFEPGDVLLHCLPVFHVHGLMVALHTAMLNASQVLFLPRFDVDDVLDALGSATVMMGVPTHYTRLLADHRFDAEACASMRLFTSGSAPMTEATHVEFTKTTGHRILERYGMSEAGMITSNPYDGDRVPGTVGFALPDVELRICDHEGAILAPGDAGVVEVRGPNLFAGYWRQPDKTASQHREDGFFITGDIGRLDDRGRLTLEGRESDMIITGGYNVYPKEVELLLDEHDSVAESAVVGIPHPDLGEAVTAFVVASDPAAFDADALVASLHGRLARFKHPRSVFAIHELPRNSMGKVLKHRLRHETPDPDAHRSSTSPS